MSASGLRSRGSLRPLGVLIGLLLVALVLQLAGATQEQISAAAADPQGYVTAAGADEFVLVMATAIGWLLLGWITLGAVLVLGSAAPGVLGWLFTGLARALLPATLRRFVSLSLGIALLSGTSVASAAPPAPMASISVTVDWPGAAEPSSIGAIPDWPPRPGPQPGPVPEATPAPTAEPQPDAQGSDRPPSVGRGSYLVQAGDCLWDIAERSLAQGDQPIDVVSVAAAVTAWWQVNDNQLTDPDLIFPGQVLTAPTLQP
ncbi:MAG: LysM peptidoglycan-binding domain-containing protein [Geodermatophilaceae bacterium]|nr:LysM peptidoglycan-binding domain-containing protein [Geodermatophilaceae bacterium]